jgi:ankyrin repeat protein
MEVKNVVDELKHTFSKLMINMIQIKPDLRIIRFLIHDLETEFNIKNHKDENIFIECCKFNQLKIAKFLFEEEKRIEEKNKQLKKEVSRIPVHKQSCTFNHIIDWKPIHFAIRRRSYKVLNWLVTNDEMYKDDPLFNYSKCCYFRRENKENCITMALDAKEHNLLKILIEKLNSITDIEPYTADYNILHKSVAGNDFVGYKKIYYLYQKIKGDNFLSRRLLLSQGDPECHGPRIIHTICGGNMKFLKFYLKSCKKFDVFDICLKSLDNNNNTCLHYACRSENLKIMKFLYKEGISIERKNNDGKTCIDLIKKKKIKNIFISSMKIDNNTPKKIVGSKRKFDCVFDKEKDFLLYNLHKEQKI